MHYSEWLSFAKSISLRLVVGLALLNVVPGQAEARAVVSLQDITASQSVVNFVEYQFETDGPLTLSQIMAEADWKRLDKDSLNFGFNQAPVWLRFDVENWGAQQLWWLYLSYFALNQIDFYLLKEGKVYYHDRVGFDYPFSKRKLNHRNYQFPLQVTGRASVYLRVESTGALYVPLEIFTEEAIANYRETNNLAYGIYAGIILAMVLYNLFLFVAIRETVYLAYIAYVASYLILVATNEGFSFQYLWPDWAAFNISASPFFACLAGIFALDFSSRFLEVGRYSVWVSYLLTTAKIITACLGILALVSRIDLNYLVNSLSVFFTLLIVVTSVYCYRKGCDQAQYFMFAWVFLLTGIFVFAGVMNGWIHSNAITRNALLVGSVAEVIMFSFALANRINTIKNEKSMVLELQQQTLHGLKQAELEIYEVAFTDRLTKLPNRELMARNFNKRFGSNDGVGSVYLLILHLKQLQEINKTLGYRVGDDLLVNVAKRLQSEVQSIFSAQGSGVYFDADKDLAALEGANFALVVSGCNDAIIERKCQQLIRLFEKPVQYQQMSIDVGVCIGIASMNNKARDFDALLKNAQVAVESALEKSLGYICYEEGQDPYSEKRITLMADLKQAIREDALDLFLQPKQNLVTQRICGFEALVRWRHDRHGYVSPEEFIPLAEKGGIINDLTDWVLQRTLDYLDYFQKRNLYPHISINISAKNLQQPFFAEQIVSALKRRQVSPGSLVLEITETAMMDDPEKALSCLHHLNQHGFRLSLDDFGTGYSSLSYLSRMPIAEIKIDKSFIEDMDNQTRPVIVETTLNMARGLRLTTVAEGIETQEALDTLRQLGCDLVQGYHLAKPMPFGQLIEWLAYQEGYEALRFELKRKDQDKGSDKAIE